MAGAVLAAILVPQGMAYAELAGLPAVNGLYCTIACLVGYALFGPSRILVLGPVLVAVLGATVASAALDLSADGVSTVGTLPRGVPAPTLPWTSLADVGPLAAAALGIALVSLTDTIALASSFAARHDEDVDANQEMIGMGASNAFAFAPRWLRRVLQHLAHRGRRVGRCPHPGDGAGRCRPRGIGEDPLG